MATIDTSGRPAYMYDEDTDTWYAISGRVSTSANYIWTGAQQYTNNVQIDGGLTVTSRINVFLNPAARASAITSPQTGLLTFIRQDAGGSTINRLEYYDGSAWQPYNDPAEVVFLDETQTLTNKTLTSPTISSPTISGSATVSADVDITGQLDVQELRETVTDVSASSGTATIDFTQTNIVYIDTAPTANFTVDVTNVPTDNGKTTTIAVFVTQGSTGYFPNVLEIDGSAQTIKWASGTNPTPTNSAGKIDIFNFTLLRRSGSWTVFGNMNANF